MPTDKILKAAGLNIGIALLNIVLFSPGLVGIELGGDSVLATAFGCAEIFLSLALFGYGNYLLLFKKEAEEVREHKLETPMDYASALQSNYGKRVFEGDIATVLEQIERIIKKTEMIQQILLEKFNDLEMGYTKFEESVHGLENVFYMNVRSILNKMKAFDEADYSRITRKDADKRFSSGIIQTKMGIYNEYIDFIKNAEQDNEEIILKLDKLLLEMSRFNSLEDGELENMSAMKEIDELIVQAKEYR